MIWQALALGAAVALVVVGVALVSIPAAFIVSGLGLGAGALFIDPASLRKGGRP